MITRLYEFVTLAQKMNFSIAADELQISQSVLSKHIKSLEEEFKVRFVKRTTRTVELTEGGRIFLHNANRIMKDYNEMMTVMSKHALNHEHPLIIRSMHLMEPYGIAKMLMGFEKQYPEILLDISEDFSQNFIKSLRNRHVEIGILFLEALPDNIDFDYKVDSIIKDDLVLVVNARHRCAQLGTISLPAFSDERYLFLSEDKLFENVFIRECVKAGFKPDIYDFNLRMVTISSMIKQGIGITILPRMMAEMILDPELRIINIRNASVLNLAFITRNEEKSLACKNFMKYSTLYYQNQKKEVEYLIEDIIE